MADNIKLNPEDRLLFIINDNIIVGSTRFQKYGFLLFEQYQKELAKLKKIFSVSSFYDDWQPHNYGPYSQQLTKDIQTCADKGILEVNVVNANTNQKNYRLTLKGRAKWRKIFFNAMEEMVEINGKIINLQKMGTFELLRQVYKAYPDYTTNSKIKNVVNDSA